MALWAEFEQEGNIMIFKHRVHCGPLHAYCIILLESWFSNERLVSNERRVKSDCFPNERSEK